MNKKTPWFLAGLLTVALALVVVACGGGEPAPPATPAPTTPAPTTPAPTTPAPTTPAPTTPAPAPATPTASLPALPGDHAGRTSCLVCHKDGLGGAPKLTASHEGRTDENDAALCLGCHKPG